MSNELHKNAEGYKDPTAAATLNRKEPGDIWTYRGGACLIIKDHHNFATVLTLHDDNQYGDRVKVIDRERYTRYVDPAFLITAFYKDMGQYKETLDVDTFTKVIRAVEDAVGLRMLVNVEMATTSPSDEEAKLLELSGKVGLLQEHLAELERLHNLQEAELTAANNAATKARNQLELLREMYDDLLAKVVGGVASDAD